MQLNRNAVGATAFIIAVILGHIWSAITPVYKPPWQPWPPLIPLMSDYVVPFLVHYYRPILIGLLGLAILWMWDGRRAGFAITIVLMVIASAFGVLVVIFNTMAQEWSGALTGIISIAFPSLMALWYSYQGYRSHGSAS